VSKAASDSLQTITTVEGELDVFEGGKRGASERWAQSSRAPAPKRSLMEAEVTLIEKDRSTQAKFKEFSFTVRQRPDRPVWDIGMTDNMKSKLFN
jgi:hypothetical protein